jgi:hypothetical protein
MEHYVANKKLLGRRLDGPLYDLKTVQQSIRDKTYQENITEAFYVANKSCEKEMECLSFTRHEVLEIILALDYRKKIECGDYKNSEKCSASDGSTYDCDVYSIKYDEKRRSRINRIGITEFYLKFKIDYTMNNPFSIILLRIHL